MAFGCEIVTECWLFLWEWLFCYNIFGRRTHESTGTRMNRDRQCCFTVSRHACHISSPVFFPGVVGLACSGWGGLCLVVVLCLFFRWGAFVDVFLTRSCRGMTATVLSNAALEKKNHPHRHQVDHACQLTRVLSLLLF